MLRRPCLLVLCAGFLLVAGCAPKPDARYRTWMAQARTLVDDPRTYVDDSRVDQAFQIAQAAILSQPRIPQAYVLAARARSLGGKGVPGHDSQWDAEAYARQAIEHGADDCEAYAVLAGELYRKQRYAEGLKELDKADAAPCSDAWRHVYRGLILNAQQHFDEAAKAFEQVPPGAVDQADARHACVQARQGLAWTAYRREDAKALHDFALAALQQADGDDPAERVKTAELLSLAGDFEAAADFAREALKRRNDAAGRAALANALYGQSLWLSSRPGDVEAGARANAMDTEAAGLDADFVRAGKVLAGSLANRDEAFHVSLQQRLQGAIQQARGDAL